MRRINWTWFMDTVPGVLILYPATVGAYCGFVWILWKLTEIG